MHRIDLNTFLLINHRDCEVAQGSSRVIGIGGFSKCCEIVPASIAREQVENCRRALQTFDNIFLSSMGNDGSGEGVIKYSRIWYDVHYCFCISDIIDVSILKWMRSINNTIIKWFNRSHRDSLVRLGTRLFAESNVEFIVVKEYN